MSYPFEDLGSTGFQDLAASLAVAVFGRQVQVMGAGRDGGRDMYADGPLTWTPPPLPHAVGEDAMPPGEQLWPDYTVFQVKHKQTLDARPQDNAAWLWGQIRDELDAWTEPADGRDRTPRQLVFVTNVALTPTPRAGGHDLIRERIAEYGQALADPNRDTDEQAAQRRRRRLQRFNRIRMVEFWDRTKLTALLNVHSDVRRAFTGLLTVADVLADLAAVSDRLPAGELEQALRAHARNALLSDGRLNFAEAGADSATVQVHDVAVDLPVVVNDTTSEPPPTVGITFVGRSTLSVGGERPMDSGAGPARRSLVGLVLDSADRVLKPKVTTQPHPRHLIVTGDPGNGKTTMSRLLTQAFRSALLADADNLGADHRAVVEGTTAALARFGRQLPRHRRWPIRIDLAEYADERGHLIDDSLLRWIAAKVSATSTLGDVTPRAVHVWMNDWPWFVALDGLDEVTEPATRARVIERIAAFVNEAEGDNCDVFVLLTSRPAGFTEAISATHFTTVALADLTEREAVDYGTTVTNLRLRGDDDRRRAVIRQLQAASESESLRHLLRTPLQVLIMTIIIDSSVGNLAPDRYSLFWGYYDTVFSRERAKQTSLRSLLRDHAPQITRLHERVGYELQRRSEDADRSFAALTEEELRQIIRDVLTSAGHKPGEAGDTLLEQIFTAATQRLVLLAPRGDGFGFDVRPLQELTAARHLTNGPFDDIAARLSVIAASPHWRNTWIFAAGRLFANDQDHQLDELLRLVEAIEDDASQRLGAVVPIGPRLALDLLDDGMARAWPLYTGRLLTAGVNVLHEPAPPDLAAIARVLLRFADISAANRAVVVDALRDLLAGPSTTRLTVQLLQDAIPVAQAQVHVRPATRGLDGVRRRAGSSPAPDPIAAWDDFNAEVDTAPLDDAGAALVACAADLIRAEQWRSPDTHAAVRAVLAEARPAAALEAALRHVLPATPALYTALRDVVLPPLYRLPTPDPLLESTV